MTLVEDEGLRRCCVAPGASLRDVLETLDASRAQIALLVDAERRLVGLLTDGDVRRALLRNVSLDAPALAHATKKYVSVDPTTSRDQVLDLMQARTVGQVPIVDAEGRLVGLHLLRQLIGRRQRDNWALVMAGGRGLRLRPVTEHIPKPMIEVAGRPILERIVLHLVGFGIRRIFLSVNYLAEVIVDHFGDGQRFGCRIDYLREETPLGTGGALSLLPTPTMPVLAMNGDLIARWNVDELLDFHDRGGYAATVGIHNYAHTVPFGVLKLEGDRVAGLAEKPTFTWPTNAGIYVLSPEAIARVPAGREYAMPALLEECIARGEPVGAFSLDGEWIDVGRQSELRRARGESIE